MKTLLQPTMSTTADTAAREGFSGNHGAPTPDTELGAELQARLADTEARLADALNRLSFREAELAALAPDGHVLATAVDNGLVILWDVTNPARRNASEIHLPRTSPCSHASHSLPTVALWPSPRRADL